MKNEQCKETRLRRLNKSELSPHYIGLFITSKIFNY